MQPSVDTRVPLRFRLGFKRTNCDHNRDDAAPLYDIKGPVPHKSTRALSQPAPHFVAPRPAVDNESDPAVSS